MHLGFAPLFVPCTSTFWVVSVPNILTFVQNTPKNLEIRTWILLYSKPTRWHRVFAPYMLLDKQLCISNMKLWSNEKNSCTNLYRAHTY
jgi:hypothetical protein